MNKTLRGGLLIVLGLILIAAASLIWVLQDRQDQLAGQSAASLLNELEQELKHPVFVSPEPSTIPQAPENSDPTPEQTLAPMPETTYSGYSMVGRLYIPVIGVQLPILSSWDYDLLKVAPCRYSGTAEGGNLILLGHNYKAHFKNLARLSPGDTVEFIAVDGSMYHYEVDAVDTIRGTDVDALASDHELNIFTCTLDRVHRTVVRCRLVRDA